VEYRPGADDTSSLRSFAWAVVLLCCRQFGTFFNVS